MKKLIFKNRNTKAIEVILKDIGKYQFEKALVTKDITNKPNKIKYFYLETNLNSVYLCYNYPTNNKSLNNKLTILRIENIDLLPTSDWELI